MPLDPAQVDLDAARQLGDFVARRAAIAKIIVNYPRSCACWADLADIAEDEVESYAYARTGYHRGLDQLRQAGWRGSGFVRWAEPTNRGMLSSVDALRKAAGVIGEADEEARCAEFLALLDPSGPWAQG